MMIIFNIWQIPKTQTPTKCWRLPRLKNWESGGLPVFLCPISYPSKLGGILTCAPETNYRGLWSKVKWCCDNTTGARNPQLFNVHFLSWNTSIWWKYFLQTPQYIHNSRISCRNTFMIRKDPAWKLQWLLGACQNILRKVKLENQERKKYTHKKENVLKFVKPALEFFNGLLHEMWILSIISVVRYLLPLTLSVTVSGCPGRSSGEFMGGYEEGRIPCT